MIYPPLNEVQLGDACRRMASLGDSFVRTVATAFQLADGANRQRLLQAFDELFRRYATWP